MSDLRHEAVNYVLVFGLASASYYLVERPFLRLKKRWDTVHVEAAPAPV